MGAVEEGEGPERYMFSFRVHYDRAPVGQWEEAPSTHKAQAFLVTVTAPAVSELWWAALPTPATEDTGDSRQPSSWLPSPGLGPQWAPDEKANDL